jgi:hypothetical protein
MHNVRAIHENKQTFYSNFNEFTKGLSELMLINFHSNPSNYNF